MNLRTFAERVLFSDALDMKVKRIDEPLTDDDPATALRAECPTRPANLQFAARKKAPAMPKAESLKDPAKRAEIRHVEFGLAWLRRFKPAEQSDWDAWTGALHWPIRPSKARGDLFQREARLQAGLTDDFIDQLEEFREAD